MSELHQAEMAAFSRPEELHGLWHGSERQPGVRFDDFVDLVGIDALSDQESLGAFVNSALTNCTTKYDFPATGC